MLKETDKNVINELALKVLELSRDTLIVNFKFIEGALGSLRPEKCSDLSGFALGNDGNLLFYSPEEVLRLYKKERSALLRSMLHTTFHCLFAHIKMPAEVCGNDENRKLWDLSCDISVEAAINRMEAGCSYFENEPREIKAAEKLVEKCGALTAEKIYRYLKKGELEEETLENYRAWFAIDSHEKWPMPDCDEEIKEKIDNWKSFAARMMVDLEGAVRSGNLKLSGIIVNLKETTRKKTDYDEFLKLLYEKGDGIKLNQDEFDYAIYTYGMEISGGRMPLIEPIEYRDSTRIKDFVIAVLPSCEEGRKPLRNLADETVEILKSFETVFTKVSVHMLDCEVNTLEAKRLPGWRGARQSRSELLRVETRDVFGKVNEMIRAHEFKNLRGVIFLMDCEGFYPTSLPQFQSYFVFLRDDYHLPNVPPWAQRLMLEREKYE